MKNSPRPVRACSKCKVKKPLSEYHVDRGRKHGHYPRCKKCVNSSWCERYKNGYWKKHLKKKWFNGNKEAIKKHFALKKVKHSKQIKAGAKLNNAVRSGVVKKFPCVVCGDKKSQGHHEDYSKPLVVVWLCDYHHKEKHGRIVRPIQKRRRK